jgi:small subunit ribosomal protein S6
MRKYEIMFIVFSALTEEDRTAAITSVEETLKSEGADNIVTEKWGERKLAYPIQKKETGFYVLTTFDIDGTKLFDVEKKLNINEKLMRYIIVKK